MKHPDLQIAVPPPKAAKGASSSSAPPLAGFWQLLDMCHMPKSLIHVPADREAQSSSWVLQMQSEQKTKHQLRNYLWIRRPVHRPGRMHRHEIKQTLGEIKAIPTLVLFASFISIAICLSIFVH